MAQPKPLFIPWLKQQIDSGRYPGVQWVNQECTKFSIPWKHALRQDSNSDDILIFKAWAQTSAGSNGQTQGDSSVWKRNFRSALRARGFQMVKDNKNDTANPHKIFAWPDDNQSGASTDDSPVCNLCPRGSSDVFIVSDSTGTTEISYGGVLYLGEEELFPGGSARDDLLQRCLEDLNIVETPPEMPSDQQVFVSEPTSTAYCNGPFPIQETLSMHHLSQADVSAGQLSPAEGTLSHSHYSPPDGAFIGTQQPTVQAELEPRLPVQSASDDPGSNRLDTHFKVNVYYRGRRVFNQVVENEDGFRLMFRNDPNLMASPLPVVQLPTTESILDRAQAQSTQSILDNLGGLEVRREDGMLLGYRWGDSRVYWGLDKHEKSPASRQLSKNQPEPIYSFRDFIYGLIEFMNNRGPSPSYSLYFFLGQQWPDPKNKPWEKKLIMVEVILTALENLKELAAVHGASSLQSSMELQISLEQMMEFC